MGDILNSYTRTSSKAVSFLLQGDASSDYSPNKLPNALAKSVSPPLNQRHRILLQQRSVPSGMTSAAASTSSKPSKFQVPRQPEESIAGGLRQQSKPLLHRSTGISSYVDHLTGDSRFESVTRDSSIGKLYSLRDFSNILFIR